MEQGKNIFTLEYDRGMIKDFEKRVLTGGVCKAFLPMSFVDFDGKENASYDAGGYRPIACSGFKNSMEMVDLVESCVFALINSNEHLINPKKIELNSETVFSSSSKREIRIAYIPRASPAGKTTDVLTELIDDLRKKAESREIQEYLRSIAAYVEYSNSSLSDVVNYLGELRQEIHSCG